MPVYRGPGGAGDATNDATVTAVQAAATSAATSATNAANSATAAANSATGAATSATNAANSATTSAGSATTAAGHATNASTFATNSSLSADDSAASATEAEGYASEAFDYKVAAASSASSASTSATNAGTSATNASNSAASALAIYGNTTAMNAAVASATASASAASTSASNASTSATTATNAASTATTQATNAAASASAADADATSAATDANEAQAAATAAQAAVNSAEAIYGSIDDIQQAEANSEANRDAAAASATSASNSASTATTQAGIATTQATNAAASAASASAVALGNEPVRHSVRPSLLLDFANTKTLDPRITYTRASTASYYDGKTTAKAEQNLLTYSEQLDNAAWLKYNTTISTNATTSPDGTTTAELAYPTSTGASRNVYRSAMVSGTQYAISVYAKAGGLNFICFSEETGSGTGKAWFNLSTGAVGTVVAGYSASITSVGNGWYRCTVIRTASGATYNWMLADADNSSTSTTSGTNGVYLWGAQLEQRSSVTAYTPTTTAAITNYIPALQTAASGVARFDHNPTTGESLGLLIEEQRTNLLTYSSDYSNAIWTKVASTIVATANIAPDGTQTAQKIVEDTSNANHFINIIAGTISSVETRSVYAKPAGRNWLYMGLGGTSSAYFDIANGALGTVSNATATITAVGNGWYRCTITATRTTNANNTIITASANGTASYTGDGFSGLFIWGAQLEAGSFATSYIPTVASQVTRSPDAASITGANFSSWYNISQGTLYSEIKFNTTVSYPGLPNFQQATLGSTNYIAVWYSGGNALSAGTRTNGVVTPTTNVSVAFTPPATAKTAFSFTTNQGYFGVNGNSPSSISLLTIPTVDTLSLTGGSNSYVYNPSSGSQHLKKIAYYAKALTSSEIQGLTTV